MFLPRCARSETLVRFYDLNSEKLRGTNEPFFLQHHFMPFFHHQALIFFVVVIIVHDENENDSMTTANVYYDIIISQLVSFLGEIFSFLRTKKKSNLNAARPRTQMLHDGLSQFINLITFLKHKS